MSRRCVLPLLICAVMAGCAREQPAVDPELAREIAGIKAIDNHAHPVLAAAGDREFDALPVDSMEESSEPVALRPDAAGTKAAAAALYAGTSKADTIRQKGDGYPAWVLDEAGIDIMLANRVAMGESVQPPRFRWVPYADALIFPLDNSRLAMRNSDRRAFFALEDRLRARYLGGAPLPATLAGYTAQVVLPVLERQRQGGAVAEKFEASYLRDLSFAAVDEAAAERVYRQYARKGVPADGEYKLLQDFLFRYIALECGRLGMAVHLHTMAGAGGYFDVAGANPLNLEPLFDDPTLRRTKFVMVHGGWPFVEEIGALLTKPNAYLDISAQTLVLPPARIAGWLREWLAYVPEKVMFATDAYPYSAQLGWEESAWVAARNGREALGRALTAMLRDGEITHQRAVELARMVLRENAKKLYGL
ncbi:MAG: amidohydrolase family protein [Acidobacteria bacterium]|nr:amidohydrolase family protein [Acidobacteriota bacterium]